MKLKKVSCILGIIAALFASSFTAMASDLSDESEQNEGENILSPIESEEMGSITITLGDTEKGLSKDNVKFSVGRVADVVNGEYVLTEEYETSEIDLNNIHNANEMSIASSELFKIAKEGIIVETSENGLVVAESLQVGVYLIYATDIAGYDNITPFLVSIPTWSEEESTMLYDLTVIPKHTPIPKEPETPQTGYENKGLIFGNIAVILLILAAIVYIATREKHDGE